MLLPALQTGGYGSPSVYGYGYGYSSPAAPAATPLFGKLNSLLLQVLFRTPFFHFHLLPYNTQLTICLLLQAHLQFLVPTAAQLQPHGPTAPQQLLLHLTTAPLSGRAPPLHLCITLLLPGQLHHPLTTHQLQLPDPHPWQPQWQPPSLPHPCLLLPSLAPAHHQHRLHTLPGL